MIPSPKVSEILRGKKLGPTLSEIRKKPAGRKRSGTIGLSPDECQKRIDEIEHEKIELAGLSA